jgi:hypothetical protein
MPHLPYVSNLFFGEISRGARLVGVGWRGGLRDRSKGGDFGGRDGRYSLVMKVGYFSGRVVGAGCS